MKRYYLWILAPIFFAFLGGIAAFLVLRKRDRDFALICLGLGIFISVVRFAIGILESQNTIYVIPEGGGEW
jgi:hypothetical protein